jgi:hypothetical protein
MNLTATESEPKKMETKIVHLIAGCLHRQAEGVRHQVENLDRGFAVLRADARGIGSIVEALIAENAALRNQLGLPPRTNARAAAAAVAVEPVEEPAPPSVPVQLAAPAEPSPDRDRPGADVVALIKRGGPLGKMAASRRREAAMEAELVPKEKPSRRKPQKSQARQDKEDAELGASIAHAIRNQHKLAAELKAKREAEAKAAAEAKKQEEAENAKMWAAWATERRAEAEARAEAKRRRKADRTAPRPGTLSDHSTSDLGPPSAPRPL